MEILLDLQKVAPTNGWKVRPTPTVFNCWGSKIVVLQHFYPTKVKKGFSSQGISPINSLFVCSWKKSSHRSCLKTQYAFVVRFLSGNSHQRDTFVMNFARNLDMFYQDQGWQFSISSHRALNPVLASSSICGRRHAKRSLMAWVGVIPKEGRARGAASALLLV